MTEYIEFLSSCLQAFTELSQTGVKLSKCSRKDVKEVSTSLTCHPFDQESRKSTKKGRRGSL